MDPTAATILIDTPPELRLQLIAAGLSNVDAVVYTHEHADHINGIDDLRMFSMRQRRPLPVYGPPETLERLRTSFNYIFDDAVRPYEGTSKPSLEMHALEPGEPIRVAGVEVLPLAFRHGHLRVFGYRLREPGVHHRREGHSRAGARAACSGLDVLVINALWWRPHPTHMSIAEAIEVAQALGATRHLSHASHPRDGARGSRGAAPPGILPAYDGLTVEVR